MDPRPAPSRLNIVLQALQDPFPALERGRVVYIHAFDRALANSHKSTRDEVEVRRARDWSLLANQEVGLEDLTAVRRV